MNKFLSFLLCIFLLFGVVGCTRTPEQQPLNSYEEQSSESSEEEMSESSEEEPQKNDEEQKALYDEIISQYTALLTAKHNNEELLAPNTENMDESESAIAETLYGIVDACKDAKAAENLGYGYKDLDDNGIPELILLNKGINIKAIFTVSAGVPILLEANYSTGAHFVFATGNRFLLRNSTISDNIEESTIRICHVDGDKMIYDLIYGTTDDIVEMERLEMFRVEDGKRTPIDKDTFRMLNLEYQKASQADYIILSKVKAPLILCPLAESKPDSNLPVADFSNYDAIRKTYITISTCLEEFKSSSWGAGEYDNLFSFPTDRSFEYYSQLLYIAYHSDQHMGYDEIDLNGDGVDELVLMNEDYRIKAIFTQKDGVPVLLDAFIFLDHTCWLDEEGLIHVDYESSYELEYGLYEFAKNGEYKLQYLIHADNYGHYLTKDGKIEPLPYEASMELYYDNYICYSEPFEPNEYTRNVSDLTYTALTEATEDMIKVAADKTWRKYADLEKTTGKTLAHSNTYVTFENVTDTQMKMSVKYAFTFSYPDPDRDHHLLNDTTESTLNFTVRRDNGVFLFEENGIQGKIEFGQKYLWIIIEESSDERFPVGNYCYSQYSS